MIIQSPLKYLKATLKHNFNEKGLFVSYNKWYAAAWKLAQRGDGAEVKNIARQVYYGNIS
jgi:hypothetical protein